MTNSLSNLISDVARGLCPAQTHGPVVKPARIAAVIKTVNGERNVLMLAVPERKTNYL